MPVGTGERVMGRETRITYLGAILFLMRLYTIQLVHSIKIHAFLEPFKENDMGSNLEKEPIHFLLCNEFHLI
jgi:hypothetical protein